MPEERREEHREGRREARRDERRDTRRDARRDVADELKDSTPQAVVFKRSPHLKRLPRGCIASATCFELSTCVFGRLRSPLDAQHAVCKPARLFRPSVEVLFRPPCARQVSRRLWITLIGCTVGVAAKDEYNITCRYSHLCTSVGAGGTIVAGLAFSLQR